MPNVQIQGLAGGGTKRRRKQVPWNEVLGPIALMQRHALTGAGSAK